MAHIETGRPARTRVSIIIAARNNGRYLEEAIRTAMAQTVACEVIYADDASNDNSLLIARSWEERGLVILPGYVHRGVCAARNRGAAVARGDYLVFLDGDDRLPKDFVARHQLAMAPGVPFVYGPARAFGDGPHAQTLWAAPEWEHYDRWRCNTVNTSAMYARWAFDAAGGWSDRVPTMWGLGPGAAGRPVWPAAGQQGRAGLSSTRRILVGTNSGKRPGPRRLSGRGPP